MKSLVSILVIFISLTHSSLACEPMTKTQMIEESILDSTHYRYEMYHHHITQGLRQGQVEAESFRHWEALNERNNYRVDIFLSDACALEVEYKINESQSQCGQVFKASLVRIKNICSRW